MKKCLLSLITYFVLSASPLISQDLNVKIMSYNMQQPHGTDWDARKATVANVINAQNCDVIGSQELHAYMRDYLLQNISGYASFGLGRDGGELGEASFIFYKSSKYNLDIPNSGNFWMSNTPNTPSRYGGSYNRICTYVRLIEKTSGQGFYVFNIHNYMPGEYDYRLAAVSFLIQQVLSRSVNDPVFLIGDFNSNEFDGVTNWIKSGTNNNLKCRDSYRDYDPTGSITTGFGTKFDYIYYPDDSKYSTLNSYVVSPSGSDHLPIIAEIKYSINSNPTIHNIPGKIEAESYMSMSGIQLENTSDNGGGQNIGYLSRDDWFSYRVHVAETKNYKIESRVASLNSNARLKIQIDNVDIKTLNFTQTNGWQNWVTIDNNLELPQGIYELKFVVVVGDVNINWFSFEELIDDTPINPEIIALTQNLWRRNDSWNNRRNNVVSMVNNRRPDFIAITEGDEGKASELTNLLNNYTLETGPWNDESTSIIFNHTTLSIVQTGVFGYSSTPDINQNSDWGDGAVYGWLRKCNWILFEHITSGERFYVYNNHLDALNSTLGPAYWRMEQVKLMADRIANRAYQQYPFIVIGDLNEHENGNAISYLKEGAVNPVQMKDTYREILPNGDGHTFGTTKLDYVLTQKNSSITTLDANIIYQSNFGHISDHNAIWAKLALGSDVSSASISLSHAEQIMEGAENGKQITVSLLNDQFVDILNISNWTIGNLPNGVTLGNVTRISSTQVTLTLSGNSNIGTYLENITNVSLTINSVELINSTTDLSTNTGVVLTKYVDPEEGVLFANYDGIDLAFSGFGGTEFSKIANPVKGGINTSDNVGRATKAATAQAWAGISSNTLSSKIDFSYNHLFKIKVYSPIICNVLLKIEDATNDQIFKEISVQNTLTNQWEELVFDFSDTESNKYNKISLFFDFGSSVGNAFYFDDIQLVGIVLGDELTDKASDIYAAPNPVKDILYLSDNCDWSMLNLEGKIVKKGSLNKIEVSDLPRGIYILMFNQKTQKIIVD